MVFWLCHREVLSVDTVVSLEGRAFIVSVECYGFCRHVARKPPVVSPAIYRELPLLHLCIVVCPGIFF